MQQLIFYQNKAYLIKMRKRRRSRTFTCHCKGIPEAFSTNSYTTGKCYVFAP